MANHSFAFDVLTELFFQNTTNSSDNVAMPVIDVPAMN